MKIEVKDGKAYIYTPYNAEFVKRLKGVGGSKWDPEKKCWSVPENSVDAVRQVMSDIYGYTDISANETVTLRITFNSRAQETRGDVVLYGKVVAHACGRDSGARAGDDVAFIVGMPEGGGGAKNWVSAVESGSVVILNSVNKNIYAKEKPAYDVTVEVMSTANTDRDSLIKERQRLMNRIEEIDRILGGIN